MLYQNFEIKIIKRRGCWVAYCDEQFNYPERLRRCMFPSGASPKEVFETAKMEIELEGMKALKRKMDKSVAEIMKLDWRNNRHNQI